MSLALLASVSQCVLQIMCGCSRIAKRHTAKKRHTWTWRAADSTACSISGEWKRVCLICGSHDGPHCQILRRGSQHSFQPIFHSSIWHWSRNIFFFFCKHDLFSKDCKQQYCHKLLSYIQAYIHTYMVIYTRDTYRKILLIIANTISNRRKKYRVWYRIW